MHLKQVELRNFRCFSRLTLDLAPLTVLLGANSTGKSSIIQGILAALQTDYFPLALSLNGTLVNLGDFQAAAHRHARVIQAPLTISLTIARPTGGDLLLSGTFVASPKSGLPQLLRARIVDPSLSIEIQRHAKRKYRATWTYAPEADPFHTNTRDSDTLRAFHTSITQILNMTRKSKADEPSDHMTTPEDPLAPGPPTGSLTFSTPQAFYAQLGHPRNIGMALHAHSIAAAITDLRNSFNYVGSFRLEPERSYFQVAKGDLKVGRDGQNYVEQIADWQEQRSGELRKLTAALVRLKLLAGVRASTLQNGLFEIKVTTRNKGVPVSLADVGFGIGQVLPILIADLQLKKAATLAISQPEIHLHPSVQADLTEYLVRRTVTAQMRYVIETHSEYMLHRLRLLIARRKLSTDLVKVLYLTNDGSSTTVHTLELTVDGRLIGAPPDFFETYMSDVLNIAMESTQ